MCYERIQQLCAKEGISIKALQRELGLNRDSIRGLCVSPEKIKIMISVSNRFGVSVDYLLGLTDDTKKPTDQLQPLSKSTQQLISLIADSHYTDKQVEIILAYLQDASNFNK